MLKTDKTQFRRTLELIAADLRHAYGFLAQGPLVSTGQQNVAGLIARQIRRVEDLMGTDDAGRLQAWRAFVCPFGCGYHTAATGDDDIAARNALAAHLQRLKHRLTRREAIERVNALDIRAVEWPPSFDEANQAATGRDSIPANTNPSTVGEREGLSEGEHSDA